MHTRRAIRTRVRARLRAAVAAAVVVRSVPGVFWILPLTTTLTDSPKPPACRAPFFFSARIRTGRRAVRRDARRGEERRTKGLLI